jgi:hypothetical protein
MTVTKRRSLFAALFLSTGAALLIYLISGISLGAAVTLVLAGAMIVGAGIWRRSASHDRAAVRQTVWAGIPAGVLATTAYDLSRFVLIELTGIQFWPFDIFTIFGQALIGVGYTGSLIAAVGIVYHLANGIGFGIAYTIMFGRHGVLAGIVWALLLEVLMVTFYPGWLGLKALNDFLQVSIVGHLVYGAVLGVTARALLQRRERATDDYRSTHTTP